MRYVKPMIVPIDEPIIELYITFHVFSCHEPKYMTVANMDIMGDKKMNTLDHG